MSKESFAAGPGFSLYRVTIRYHRQTQRYEIIEVEAAHQREALAMAMDRFPPALLDTADLAEVRLANPADRPTMSSTGA